MPLRQEITMIAVVLRLVLMVTVLTPFGVLWALRALLMMFIGGLALTFEFWSTALGPSHSRE